MNEHSNKKLNLNHGYYMNLDNTQRNKSIRQTEITWQSQLTNHLSIYQIYQAHMWSTIKNNKIN